MNDWSGVTTRFDSDSAREAARRRWAKQQEEDAASVAAVRATAEELDLETVGGLALREVAARLAEGRASDLPATALLQLAHAYLRIQEADRERAARNALPEFDPVDVLRSAQNGLPDDRYRELRLEMISRYEETLADLRAMPG